MSEPNPHENYIYIQVYQKSADIFAIGEKGKYTVVPLNLEGLKELRKDVNEAIINILTNDATIKGRG